MSAVNRVRAFRTCPNCRNIVHFEVQFKYGEVREYTYAVGDAIRRDANGATANDERCVVADGIAQPCPVCAYGKDSDYEVWLEEGAITAVIPATGRFNFAQVEQPFFVVEGRCDASTPMAGAAGERRSAG